MLLGPAVVALAWLAAEGWIAMGVFARLDRDYGIVFQSYALFPNLTVAENIALQLERRVMFRRAMKEAVSRAMRMGALGIRVQGPKPLPAGERAGGFVPGERSREE